MTIQDQSASVAFLQDPESYGLVDPVDTIETHISMIFLTDDRAFKMKRAVDLPYVDFSSPQLRLAACLKELELNGRTAPGLYLGVRRITREGDGRLVFDGSGELVDAVVEMKRFDQDGLFDRMAVDGRLTSEMVDEVARTVATFHSEAPVVRAESGSANLSGVLDINEAGFATSHIFDDQEVERFNTAFRTALSRHADRLDDRERRGMVRRCHGDLHLRNICLFDGGPRLFDCIEFNEQLATIDVLYDLAFLLMDLWHRDLSGYANLVTNRYLNETGNDDGLILLPFFMAVRAAVRAHVTATQIEEGGDRSDELVERARSYFDLALSLLEPRTPSLVAIGGLSGSGKSTVAEGLAPLVGAPPGARVLESDRTRKSMFSVTAETRLPPEAYEPDVSEKVYATLADKAGGLLEDGCTVVVDAVFDRPELRQRIAEVAHSRSIPFTGIWLEADANTLRRRVAGRRPGASDATIEVLNRQLKKGVGEIGWHHLDARHPVRLVLEEIQDIRESDR